MKLTYTCTLEDYKAAFKLHWHYRLISRIVPYLWPILTFVGFVGWLRFSTLGRLGLMELSCNVGGLSFIYWIIMLANRYFVIRINYKRNNPPIRTNQEHCTEINDECIVDRIPGISEQKYFWNAIVDFVQDEKSTLLYHGKNRFIFFATRALSPEQRTELNDLVARNLVRKQK